MYIYLGGMENGSENYFSKLSSCFVCDRLN